MGTRDGLAPPMEERIDVTWFLCMHWLRLRNWQHTDTINTIRLSFGFFTFWNWKETIHCFCNNWTFITSAAPVIGCSLMFLFQLHCLALCGIQCSLSYSSSILVKCPTADDYQYSTTRLPLPSAAWTPFPPGYFRPWVAGRAKSNRHRSSGCRIDMQASSDSRDSCSVFKMPRLFKDF